MAVGVGGVNYEVESVVGPLTFTPTIGAPVDTLLFDLNLGVRFAPNDAAGVRFFPSGHVGLRLEGHRWFTLLREAVGRETVVQDYESPLKSRHKKAPTLNATGLGFEVGNRPQPTPPPALMSS